MAVAVVMATGLSVSGANAGAAGRPATAMAARPAARPQVGTALAAGASAPLRDYPHDRPSPHAPQQALPRHASTPPAPSGGPDAALQTASPALATPAVTSFDGTGNVDSVIPPDTDGAVGPNAYVELVNMHFEVFTKAGAPLAGPTESAQLWSAFASATSAAKLCYSNPGGDGIVLYDRGANRWVVQELAFSNVFSGPFIGCFAVSQTADPTGAYYVYAFQLSSNELPDYPKLGIWGSSYYLSANMFSSPFASSSNAEVWAFDRTGMLTQTDATYVTFGGYVPSSYNTLLPANVEGASPPPAGAPEVFAGLDFSTNTTLGLWFFSPVDWTNPSAATFTGPANVTVAAYSTLCNLSQNCLPQPNTSQTLDAISDRVMQSLDYRNFGTYEALVVDHSVNASTSGTHAGVRWYELSRPLSGGAETGAWSLAQQGTFAPDSTNRWMGSTAMDGAGDIALGYSAASSSLSPSIRFTGRLNGDPAGQMTVTEGTIQAGTGSQTGYNRWGDYTDMAVDPSNDCTFFYVGEYYAASSASGWQTRIGSFQLSSCTASPGFSLGVSPSSETVTQGSPATFTVSVTPFNGFTGNVTLGVSGLPSGATASFSPNPTATSSTLTITTTSSTATGTFPLTITGTASGVANQTAAASLTVDPPVTATTIGVTQMTGYDQRVSTSAWTTWASATVKDQNGNPVSGATVTFSFTGGASATRTCTTDATGSCSTSANPVKVSMKKPSETITMTNVAKSGTTWNGVEWQVVMSRP